jgi:hypothetical protein
MQRPQHFLNPPPVDSHRENPKVLNPEIVYVPLLSIGLIIRQHLF